MNGLILEGHSTTVGPRTGLVPVYLTSYFVGTK